MSSPLARYRFLAWVVGVLLVVLGFVAMPLKYLADSPELVEVVAPAHGALFMVYLVVALLLAVDRRWPIRFTLLVLLSGAVPLLSFVMERQVTSRERSALPR